MFNLTVFSKKYHHAILLILCLIAFSSFANNKTSTRTTYSDIKWKELPGNRAIANIQGDFTKAAHLKFIKLNAGDKTQAHIHSHSYTGIVVTGTARHYEPSKPETQTVLPVGSYWTIPANVVHISECLPGNDCIFVTQSDGAFDIKLAD